VSKPFFGLLMAAVALVVIFAVITGRWADVWSAITGADASGSSTTSSATTSSAGQPALNSSSFGGWGTTTSPSTTTAPTSGSASSPPSYTNSIANSVAAYEAAIPAFASSASTASTAAVKNLSPYANSLNSLVSSAGAVSTGAANTSAGLPNLSSLLNFGSLFSSSNALNNGSSEPAPLANGTVADNPSDTGQVDAVTSGIAAGLTDGLSTLALAA
jgi:hypothetical protein